MVGFPLGETTAFVAGRQHGNTQTEFRGCPAYHRTGERLGENHRAVALGRARPRRTLTYPKNNEPRMNYTDYRKQGLPVSSSMVESLIKEVNYRVKGTEKFWDKSRWSGGHFASTRRTAER